MEELEQKLPHLLAELHEKLLTTFIQDQRSRKVAEDMALSASAISRLNWGLGASAQMISFGSLSAEARREPSNSTVSNLVRDQPVKEDWADAEVSSEGMLIDNKLADAKNGAEPPSVRLCLLKPISVSSRKLSSELDPQYRVFIQANAYLRPPNPCSRIPRPSDIRRIVNQSVYPPRFTDDAPDINRIQPMRHRQSIVTTTHNLMSNRPRRNLRFSHGVTRNQNDHLLGMHEELGNKFVRGPTASLTTYASYPRRSSLRH